MDVQYLPDNGWPECMVAYYASENEPKAGDRAEITCTATDGNPFPNLVWYNGSDVLDGTYTTPEGEDDKITSNVFEWLLTAYDNGKNYQCIGEHQLLTMPRTCDTGVLDIKFSPTLQTCTKNNGDTFDETDDFVITCESDGNPLATLQWINESSSEVMQETTFYQGGTAINEHSWSLTRGDNQVSFKCNSFNDVENDILTCSTGPIMVHFAPLSVSLYGYTETIKKGEFLELSCVTGSSNPQSTVSWYKNNQLISEGDHEEIQEEIITYGEFSGKITEGGLHFEMLASHNQNEFFCKASRNGYSNEHLSASITTKVFFPPSEPDGCITSLTGYSTPVVEGDDLVLTCTSCSGNPTPIIEWFREDNLNTNGLSDVYHLPGEYHGETGVQNLTLHVTYQHHGQRIRCESYNEKFETENDRVLSEEIKLDVQYAPFVENEEINQRYTVNLTDNAELRCEINCNPEVEITWFDIYDEAISNRTGKFLIDKTTSVTVTTGILTILNVSETDFGDYRCHAINNIDDINFTIHLSGKRRPHPAYDVKVTNKTEESLTFKWTPGLDGGLPQQFQLEYQECGTIHGHKRTAPTTNTTETIYGLLAMTEYCVTVVSFNNIGEIHSDPPTKDTTLPATPAMHEEVHFDQYSGELEIEAPEGSCIRVDEYVGNGNWTIHRFDPINEPCDRVTLTIEGSVLLRIYFCNGDYTECGEPLEYEFHAASKSNTGAIIGTAVMLAVLIALLFLGIILYMRNKKSKGNEESQG
ncbi:nephrin-like [Ptychodera flava]|uniref:nephrin-like n=1 Tax=Ptychodera flava TaxID=63121 RepID=UPI00396A5ADF